MKSVIVFLALVAVALGRGFDADAYMQQTAPAQTGLVDKMTSLGLTKLVALIEKAGLTHTLNTKGPFTVFAPTNDAIDVIPAWRVANVTDLTDFLTYHVVPGKVMSTAITDNLMAPTLLKDVSVRANVYTSWQFTGVTVSGSRVTEFDIAASNGVIHVIDKCMSPIPKDDVIGAMKKTPGLSVLLDLIKLAGLETALKGTGPFTIFAPSNDAFLKIPAANITALLQNKTLLTEVLTYHVTPGVHYTTNTAPDSLIPTLEGKNVLYHPEKTMTSSMDTEMAYYINMCKVEIADQTVMNGVIWILEDVLSAPISL